MRYNVAHNAETTKTNMEGKHGEGGAERGITGKEQEGELREMRGEEG